MNHREKCERCGAKEVHLTSFWYDKENDYLMVCQSCAKKHTYFCQMCKKNKQEQFLPEKICGDCIRKFYTGKREYKESDLNQVRPYLDWHLASIRKILEAEVERKLIQKNKVTIHDSIQYGSISIEKLVAVNETIDEDIAHLKEMIEKLKV